MSNNELTKSNDNIRNLIYTVRGKQVMLDSDLAELYQVETKYMNRAAKRNEARFPEDFRFQLTKNEYEDLGFQFGTSNATDGEKRGGRRTLPYVYTEQGISMLAGVLHTDIAIEVSLRIMRTFVEMRRFFANNTVLFDRISGIELKQLEYQKSTDEKFDRVFDYISEHNEPKQKVFFNGQIYDAFSLLISLIKKAKKEIVLIDGYVDVATLGLLAQKKKNVAVTIYTFTKTKLTADAVSEFNEQYPTLAVKHDNSFHDRLLILDKKTAYLVGASLKDAGKKTFAISLIEDREIIKGILKRLK
ncbi:MAG: ORF6N domain-containing protein [Lachnospiraceae bacterium]|nr:ORF6N domain-containing protein [Lachnospiraceae bacterium]